MQLISSVIKQAIVITTDLSVPLLIVITKFDYNILLYFKYENFHNI
jgi:hypothetical protein